MRSANVDGGVRLSCRSGGSMRKANLQTLGLCLAFVPGVLACSERSRSDVGGWTGSMDTLASGQVVVMNTDRPLWPAGSEWRIVEEYRIGTVSGTGPDLFGRIMSLEVDPAERIYVLEFQSQELRVFNADGTYLRTIGRKGHGPGEFAQALMVKLAPDGNIWVVDPENDRISVFDTAGTYLHGQRTLGGFILVPWPGGFDDAGSYYTPVLMPAEENARIPFRVALEKYDTRFELMDTIVPPLGPDRGETTFSLRRGDSSLSAGIPFTPEFHWHLHPSGTIWALDGGRYRLVQVNDNGDTLRTITREFEPYPVTDAELESAIADLDWFVQEGGKIERGKIPSRKPPAEDFFFDDRGRIYVVRATTLEDEGKLLDVFDLDGRYLGQVRSPFSIRRPYPIIRGSIMWAVTTDTLGVPFVVRAHIIKPSATTRERER